LAESRIKGVDWLDFGSAAEKFTVLDKQTNKIHRRQTGEQRKRDCRERRIESKGLNRLLIEEKGQTESC
jgi:hypothetical protein